MHMKKRGKKTIHYSHANANGQIFALRLEEVFPILMLDGTTLGKILSIYMPDNMI